VEKWLGAALDYIPRWIEHQMRLSEQPGCVVAVADKGRVVLEQAWGYANLARRVTLTHATGFAWPRTRRALPAPAL
jgi:D-alanyl-D-alanine carboxypeptidase